MTDVSVMQRQRILSLPIYMNIPEFPPLDLSLLEKYLKSPVSTPKTPVILTPTSDNDSQLYEITLSEPEIDQPPPPKDSKKSTRSNSKLHSILGDDFEKPVRDFTGETPPRKTSKAPTPLNTQKVEKEEPLHLSKSFHKIKIPVITTSSPGYSRRGSDDPTTHVRTSSHSISPRILNIRDSPIFNLKRVLEGTPPPISPRKDSPGSSKPTTPRLKENTSPATSPRGFFGALKSFMMKSSHVDDNPLLMETMQPVSQPILPELEHNCTSDDEEEEIKDWDTFPEGMPLEDRLWYLGMH